MWLVALGLLFFVLHREFLWRMYRIATGEWGGDWSHALLIPLISVYFVYQHKTELIRTVTRVYWPGLVVLFLGLGGFAFWIYPGRNDMFQGYCMIISLFGLVLFLFGPRMMRLLWFPILYLSIGVRVAPRLWDAIAAKLQFIAAQAAAVVLKLAGLLLNFNAEVRGSTIELWFVDNGRVVKEGLNIAEACAGLRMLMAFVALGVAMAYISSRPWWHRLILVLLTIPVAIAVNVGRVSALGVLYAKVNREMASGDFHTMIGLFMLIPAALVFLLIGWVLDRIVVEDESSGTATPSKTERPTSVADSDQNMAAKIGKGFCAGAVLTALMGTNGALGLATIRPDLFPQLLEDASGLLWIVAALILLGVAWLTYRLVRPETLLGTGSRNAALGVTAGVLLMAVLGLRGVVEATETVLLKEEIPLREPLYRVGDARGWKVIKQEVALTGEALLALGTRDYLAQWYRDTALPENAPGAMAKLHVAYYTGSPDTVPHVPERCFTAGGLQWVGKGRTTIVLDSDRYRQDDRSWLAVSRLNPRVRIPVVEFPATIFSFAHPDDPSNVSNVLYFFVANGKFLSSPDLVRLHGFDPRDQYSYYCKIEILFHGLADKQLASERVSSLLTATLPEIMACLPDWVEVNEGRYP